MIIGVPKEIIPDENRVGLTPSGVKEFILNGHKVLVEKNAGVGSGFNDKDYVSQGAKIAGSIQDIYKNSDLIIKVKEPLTKEINLFKPNQILFTFLHLAPNKELTKGLLNKKVVSIAYETIEVNKKLVLLEPMSEIAGKMAAIIGAYYLAKPHGGSGILAGGVPGIHSANFLILGGGTAGLNAAKVAAGLGARVVVMDIDLERMRYLEDVLPKNCEMVMSNQASIEKELTIADVIIGTVLIPGAKTPKLVTKKMLKLINPGSVLIDVSIDQGGCFETSKPTTHSDPVYLVDGILHYSVRNMPGAYPRSSTVALTNATLNYCLKIANLGWKEAVKSDLSLAKGLNTALGLVTYKEVALAHNYDFTPPSEIL